MYLLIENSTDNYAFINSFMCTLSILFTIALGIMVYFQNDKLTKLQAKLDLSNQHLFSIESEKRKVLLEYYDIMTSSIDHAYSIQAHNYTEETETYWNNLRRYNSAYHRVDLFLKETEFGKKAISLSQEIQKMKRIAHDYWVKFHEGGIEFSSSDHLSKKLNEECDEKQQELFLIILKLQDNMQDFIFKQIKDILAKRD